jgi:hypothetical protein
MRRDLNPPVAQLGTGGELSDVIMQKLRAIDAKGSYERSPMIDGRLNINLP